VEALLADKEVDVAEAEWSGVTGGAVLARAEEEKETEPGHVNDGKVPGVAGQGGKVVGMEEELDWHRLYAGRSRVAVTVCGEQGGEAVVEEAVDVEAGIGGPHAGERLCNV
jgi:hypothetical protein